MIRTCLATLLGVLVTACASNPQAHVDVASGPLRVSYVDYRNQTVLELVNTAHTDRVEQYSKARDDAGRKVQSNEIMQALIEFLDSNGFAELAQPGSCAPKGDGRALWALEIERENATRHVVYPVGLGAEQKKRYGALWQGFLDTYNQTYGLQSVKVKAGDTPFVAPEPPRKRN